MTDQRRELTRDALVELNTFFLSRLQPHNGVPTARVEREKSHLARLLRRSMSQGGPTTLVELARNPELCARILRQPGKASASEVSAWLQAFWDFLQAMLPEEEAAHQREAIDSHLIPRPTRSWHQAERVGGGSSGRLGRAPRLLFAEDLMAVAEKAREGKRGEHAQRDLALVSMFCWSPLRSKEIERLQWEQVSWHEPQDDAPFTAWVRLRRNDFELQLPVHRRAVDPLAVLYAITKRVMDRRPEGPVFRSLRHPYGPLSYREIKEICDDALSRVGLTATRHDLLAAFAYFLMKTYDYTIPDLKEALGYSEVKHVRMLLETHHGWELNQKADKRGGPVQ